MARFLLRVFVSGLAVLAAATLFGGKLMVGGNGTEDSLRSVLVFSLVLGVLNASIKPVLLLLTLPLTLASLGLFALVVNALVFWLATVVPTGVRVTGFEGAFLGALAVTVVNMIASRLERA